MDQCSSFRLTCGLLVCSAKSDAPQSQGFDEYFGLLHNLDSVETVHFEKFGGVPLMRGSRYASMTGLSILVARTAAGTRRPSSE